MSAKSMSRSLVLCESEDEAVAAMPLVLCKSEFETAAELAEKQPKSVSDGDDFMGSAASIKALFTLPFAGSGSRPHEVLAVHRVGDALVFEDIHEIAASAALGSSRGVEVEEEEQSVIHLLQALAEPPEAFAQDHMAPSLLPSAEWLLPAPQRPLHTFHWKFNQYNIVVGSDVEVYRGDGAHPAVSLRQHESGTMWEPCTALDAYLDNIMGAIPELCLSLESKGFIQGYKLLPTATIPSADVSDSSLSGKLLEAPLFDSADVEMNATMLMKFLQANCKRDGSTYLLQREPAEDPDAAPDSIRLYDLSAMSQAPSRKWKWLLSMLCFRFASRLRLRALDPRGGEESTEFREALSMRQRELLETCLALLTQLADLGGHGHDMIRASVYDQLAESYTRPAVVSKPNNPSAENALSGHAPFSGDTATAKPKDLQGWPGWEQEEELKNVRVDDLEKALLNLSRGIVVFEGLLQSKALEETEDDDEGAEEDNDIDESVRSDLCRLRLRAAEVGLALASRQIASWQASSAMSNLRDLSSKYLLPLVRECNEDTYNAAVAEVISWLWIQTGRFARAVAMDRDSWIDKSGMVAGDVLLLLNELSGILDDSSFNGPSLYNVRFSDRNGWQHLADLEASGIALPSLGPRPSGDDTLLRDRHTASTLPLSVACALCAARALHSTLSASSNANCKAARLLKSRLGDACNEVGKQLMASAEYARLWYAVVWFGRGLAVFRDIGDKTNSALLLCNLASVKKLAAGRLEASEMELFEALLDESINDCTAAQSSLEVRGAAPHAWDFIAKEVPCLLLCKHASSLFFLNSQHHLFAYCYETQSHSPTFRGSHRMFSSFSCSLPWRILHSASEDANCSSQKHRKPLAQ